LLVAATTAAVAATATAIATTITTTTAAATTAAAAACGKELLVELLGDERGHDAVKVLAEEFGQRGRALQVLAEALAVDLVVAHSLEDVHPRFAGVAREQGLHVSGAE
jgi:hypothetical protein